MQGRHPTSLDIERMKKALAYVTAYDMGTEENEFAEFVGLLKEEEEPTRMTESLAMFSWLLLQSMNDSGLDKEDILAWYGLRFEEHASSLEE